MKIQGPGVDSSVRYVDSIDCIWSHVLLVITIVKVKIFPTCGPIFLSWFYASLSLTIDRKTDRSIGGECTVVDLSFEIQEWLVQELYSITLVCIRIIVLNCIVQCKAYFTVLFLTQIFLLHFHFLGFSPCPF